MKKLFLGLLVFTTATLVRGAPSDSASPSVSITVNSDSKELAAGFAQAFARLRHVPFHVQLQRDGKTTVINDIKAATAENGVLLLETGKGLFYAVNPKDVIWLSDAPIVVEKTAPAAAK